ncbi:MAG: phosphate transport system regulatory protein PhoU [Chlorobiaceae bacterium]|nr:phosphate transport system regulatory protein PhoU [Chlorobiaceae bacterium]MBA4310037.1 phosphate transport system regulatory protein PhoU [Chlorobiaceae bacterium]
MERNIDQQLEKLKTRLIKMCSLVDEQVEFAIKSVVDEDRNLANIVIERDRKVDKYDLKVDKICQKIFALNQPVAMDLRLIMSALNINSNLERMGDIAVNIAENFLRLQQKPVFFERTNFIQMSVTVREMIKNSIDSFIDRDAKLAEKVILMDSVLDKLFIENNQIMIDIMKESINNIDTAVLILDMAKELERIGDHATNIAEDVFFIVEAQQVKHNYERFFFNDSRNPEREKEEEDED